MGSPASASTPSASSSGSERDRGPARGPLGPGLLGPAGCTWCRSPGQGAPGNVPGVALPEDFWWGVAFASVQAEGAAPESDWRDWERQGRAPYSGEGGGFGTSYRDDLRLFAAHNLRHVRLTLEWSRLEPTNGNVDPWAVEHYRRVLAAAADAGLAVWATLVDRTLPGWFGLDERGFRDQRARSYYWPRHVERCAEAFGADVHAWVPIARPLRLARAGYLVGSAPPGRTDPRRFGEALVGAHQAGLEAWRVLRGGPPVATCYDVADVRPAEAGLTERRAAAQVDRSHWGWTTAFRDGLLELGGGPQVQVPLQREAFDLVGLTIEDRVRVDAEGRWTSAHVPEDVAALVRRVAEEGPERPVVVLGQHIASPDELGGVADELDGAVADGVPLHGWFAEPAIDGYEGALGATERGLFTSDRQARPQAELLAELAGRSRPPDDFSNAVLLGGPG
ncbi:MAG: family 1 glycosylhydrolase [Acidimicrobiia bacterium]|nr:family 1 glycosylhydrolase [Acidimicrobiia bacterium]